MYGCESRTIRKGEHWRIDSFELWCWRRLVRVLWIARRSNLSILKEISSEYSLEGLMLKLKLHYFGHLMWRINSFEKTLMLGKIEGGKRRGWQRMSWLDGIMMQRTRVWVGSGSWWWTGKPGVLQSIRPQKVGHDWMTELNWICFHLFPVIVQDVSHSHLPTYFHDLLKRWGTLPFPSHFWMVDQYLLLSLVSHQNQIGPRSSCIESSFPWAHMQLLSSLWATDLHAYVQCAIPTWTSQCCPY